MPATIWASGARCAGWSSVTRTFTCLLGQTVLARVGRRRWRLDHEEPGDSLLLQPLAGVARRNARARRQLDRRERAIGPECFIEPQLLAEIDAEQLQRLDRGFKQPRRQRLFRRNSSARHV